MQNSCICYAQVIQVPTLVFFTKLRHKSCPSSTCSCLLSRFNCEIFHKRLEAGEGMEESLGCLMAPRCSFNALCPARVDCETSQAPQGGRDCLKGARYGFAKAHVPVWRFPPNISTSPTITVHLAVAVLSPKYGASGCSFVVSSKSRFSCEIS